MKYTSLALVLAFVLAGCSTSQTAYKQYEWYKDTYAAHKSNVGKVKIATASFTDAFASNANMDEITRLRIELSAIRHVCLDNVEKYNSESTKTIKEMTLPNDVPLSLSQDECQ